MDARTGSDRRPGSDWLAQPAPGDSRFDRVVNHRPAYAEALRDVERAIWSQDAIGADLLELCRLRIATLLGCRAGLEAVSPGSGAADPELVSSLSGWATDPRFGTKERVCLALAEQLLLDAQGVSDEQAAAAISALGEGGFLVLLYACGIFETTQRARLLIGAESW